MNIKFTDLLVNAQKPEFPLQPFVPRKISHIVFETDTKNPVFVKKRKICSVVKAEVDDSLYVPLDFVNWEDDIVYDDVLCEEEQEDGNLRNLFDDSAFRDAEKPSKIPKSSSNFHNEFFQDLNSNESTVLCGENLVKISSDRIEDHKLSELEYQLLQSDTEDQNRVVLPPSTLKDSVVLNYFKNAIPFAKPVPLSTQLLVEDLFTTKWEHQIDNLSTRFELHLADPNLIFFSAEKKKPKTRRYNISNDKYYNLKKHYKAENLSVYGVQHSLVATEFDDLFYDTCINKETFRLWHRNYLDLVEYFDKQTRIKSKMHATRKSLSSQNDSEAISNLKNNASTKLDSVPHKGLNQLESRHSDYSDSLNLQTSKSEKMNQNTITTFSMTFDPLLHAAENFNSVLNLSLSTKSPVVLLEYLEEYPLPLCKPGMASLIEKKQIEEKKPEESAQKATEAAVDTAEPQLFITNNLFKSRLYEQNLDVFVVSIVDFEEFTLKNEHKFHSDSIFYRNSQIHLLKVMKQFNRENNSQTAINDSFFDKFEPTKHKNTLNETRGSKEKFKTFRNSQYNKNNSGHIGAQDLLKNYKAQIQMKARYHITKVSQFFSVSQLMPTEEIYSPHSKQCNTFCKTRIQQMFLKLNKNLTTTVKMKDLDGKFNTFSEGLKRKWLKEFAIKNKDNSYSINLRGYLHVEDLLPESVCLYEAMLFGEMLLKEDILTHETTPWNLTRNYIKNQIEVERSASKHNKDVNNSNEPAVKLSVSDTSHSDCDKAVSLFKRPVGVSYAKGITDKEILAKKLVELDFQMKQVILATDLPRNTLLNLKRGYYKQLGTKVPPHEEFILRSNSKYSHDQTHYFKSTSTDSSGAYKTSHFIRDIELEMSYNGPQNYQGVSCRKNTILKENNGNDQLQPDFRTTNQEFSAKITQPEIHNPFHQNQFSHTQEQNKSHTINTHPETRNKFSYTQKQSEPHILNTHPEMYSDISQNRFSFPQKQPELSYATGHPLFTTQKDNFPNKTRDLSHSRNSDSFSIKIIRFYGTKKEEEIITNQKIITLYLKERQKLKKDESKKILIKCSKCKQIGHMKTNKQCKFYEGEKIDKRNKDREMKRKKNLLSDSILKVIYECYKIKYGSVFHKPVNTKKFVDYLIRVKKPIDLSVMKTKARLHEYSKYSQFLDDLNLMYENCCTYNGRDHTFSKIAKDMLNLGREWREKNCDLIFLAEEAFQEKFQSHPEN